MTDEQIYKEVAEAALKTLESYEVTACGVKIQWVRIYHIFRVWNLKNEFVAEHADLPTAVTLARAKLQAERDAKDAPRLREENEKMRAIIRRVVDYTSPHLPRMFDEGKKLHAEMTEAIKETP